MEQDIHNSTEEIQNGIEQSHDEVDEPTPHDDTNGISESEDAILGQPDESKEVELHEELGFSQNQHENPQESQEKFQENNTEEAGYSATHESLHATQDVSPTTSNEPNAVNHTKSQPKSGHSSHALSSPTKEVDEFEVSEDLSEQIRLLKNEQPLTLKSIKPETFKLTYLRLT